MTRYLLNHRVYYDDEKCTLNDEGSVENILQNRRVTDSGRS